MRQLNELKEQEAEIDKLNSRYAYLMNIIDEEQ